MATPKLEDYTIAWVCALPLEAAAARPVNNSNTYEFGELNGHHIVIACLPNEEYKTISIATIVYRMRITFPRLQFGLMVEIGRGVPSRKKCHPISWRMIRFVIIRRFGVENLSPQAFCQPPQPDNMKEKFSPSEEHEDFLFYSFYHHTNQGSYCEKCDKEQLVKRQPCDGKKPYIHSDLIAPGDHVMTDSNTRDQLAQQGILCFDMEAARFMNELPTFLIRRICDYRDSHRQRQWQGLPLARGKPRTALDNLTTTKPQICWPAR
ncbi:hypothetical protein BDW72DRAFT_208740 [Aspergillus terricola var. indicus]